ncbi:MAG: EamA family transporter [Sulfurimonas sp.]|nr:EamA family transporter [Sulfurimonas sp.]
MEVIIACLIIVLTTTGQILLKTSATSDNESKKKLIFMTLGYFVFLLTVLLSYELMKSIQMKYFTVIMSLNYISVLLGSKIFLEEKLDRNKILGTALVAVGIFIFLIK